MKNIHKAKLRPRGVPINEHTIERNTKPLGFLNQQNFESVISKGRLVNDTAWTIPIVLDVDEDTSKKMKESGDVLLKNPEGTGIAILHVEEVYSFDKKNTVTIPL